MGILIFAVRPALASGDWRTAACTARCSGFFAYATYDLTNFATMKVWTLRVTLLDIAWGTFLTGTVASAASIVALKFRLTNPVAELSGTSAARQRSIVRTEKAMRILGTILIIVLLLLLLGAWPSWPHSSSWGYYPSGTLGLVLVIVLVWRFWDGSKQWREIGHGDNRTTEHIV